MKTTTTTITPKFPSQASITDALSKLSETDRQLYHELQHQYISETQKDQPDHERISELMKEAMALLS